MNVERWGKSSGADKDALRLKGAVEHAPMSRVDAVDNSEPTAAEGIISASDRGTKEELMGALRVMMDSIGLTPETLNELDGDEERINRVNTLAADYLEATKKMDFKRRAEVLKSVARLFG